MRSRIRDGCSGIYHSAGACAAQACDGVLTYVGISAYGLRVEGNPVLTWMMQAMGRGVALAAAKAMSF